MATGSGPRLPGLVDWIFIPDAGSLPLSFMIMKLECMFFPCSSRSELPQEALMIDRKAITRRNGCLSLFEFSPSDSVTADTDSEPSSSVPHSAHPDSTARPNDSDPQTGASAV